MDPPKEVPPPTGDSGTRSNTEASDESKEMTAWMQIVMTFLYISIIKYHHHSSMSYPLVN